MGGKFIKFTTVCLCSQLSSTFSPVSSFKSQVFCISLKGIENWRIKRNRECLKGENVKEF